MHLHNGRKRAGAGGPVNPRQQGLATLALIFDILDPDLRPGLGFDNRGHGAPPAIAGGL